MSNAELSLLETFAAGWKEHDVEKLMSCMTEDCVFARANGVESVGADEVRAAFAGIFAAIPDADWSEARHIATPQGGASESRFTGTAADGTAFDYWIVDIFEFAGGKIRSKNTYRKV